MLPLSTAKRAPLSFAARSWLGSGLGLGLGSGSGSGKKARARVSGQGRSEGYERGLWRCAPCRSLPARCPRRHAIAGPSGAQPRSPTCSPAEAEAKAEAEARRVRRCVFGWGGGNGMRGGRSVSGALWVSVASVKVGVRIRARVGIRVRIRVWVGSSAGSAPPPLPPACSPRRCCPRLRPPAYAGRASWATS